MTLAAIHQPQYLPYLGFFHKIYHSDVYVVLDDVQYHRRGVQNRNKVKTSTGWQWLTVPIIHQSGGQLIRNVEIKQTTQWQNDHWKTLVFNYSPAPYFDLYRKELKQILFANYTFLSTLNMVLIEWVLKILDIRLPIFYSSQLETIGQKTERIVSICQAVDADCYLSGPGGKQYMAIDSFEEAGIGVQWQNFNPPVYEQRFPHVEFIPNLSILDVLFNCGPATIQFLQ